jgi:hypothetical protein
MVREAEVQLSRERARMAHERAELDRLRSEIRLEQERTRREGGARKQVRSSVRRLQQALTDQRQDGAEPAGGPRSRQLRNLRPKG